MVVEMTEDMIAIPGGIAVDGHTVYRNGKPAGYYTRFAGLYVCFKCGHLCDESNHDEDD
jgi:hypothetical protein